MYLDDYFDDKTGDKIFNYLKISGFQLSVSHDIFQLFYSFGDHDITHTFRGKEAFKSFVLDIMR